MEVYEPLGKHMLRCPGSDIYDLTFVLVKPKATCRMLIKSLESLCSGRATDALPASEEQPALCRN